MLKFNSIKKLCTEKTWNRKQKKTMLLRAFLKINRTYELFFKKTLIERKIEKFKIKGWGNGKMNLTFFHQFTSLVKTGVAC